MVFSRAMDRTCESYRRARPLRHTNGEIGPKVTGESPLKGFELKLADGTQVSSRKRLWLPRSR